MPRKSPAATARSGIGQLTLVEHALCPLDAKASLRRGLVHRAEFAFHDPHRRTGQAEVLCPLGLSANDELILWGLLGLTLSQPGGGQELHAPQSYYLQRLGLIPRSFASGGKNFADFRATVRRLAAVTYQNDSFYHPIRRERLPISFRFFSYILPRDPNSLRAWRFVWDPVFFEICQHVAGRLMFDWPTYQRLDCASRRLYLLLHKIFWRRNTSPSFDVREIVTNVLGYAKTLPIKAMNARVDACATRLLAEGIIRLPQGTTDVKQLRRRKRTGAYSVRFQKGPHFDGAQRGRNRLSADNSALAALLASIGFDSSATGRILRRYEPSQIATWSDVTLAARERFGDGYFSKSAQAFFMDNLKNAAAGGRTPPDWYRELARREQLRRDERNVRRSLQSIQGHLTSDKQPRPSRGDFRRKRSRTPTDTSNAPEWIADILHNCLTGSSDGGET